MQRKDFIRKAATASALIGFSQFPIEAFAKGDVQKLSILHTNDQHSRIEPFPMDGGKWQGMGGFAQRATLISEIRKQEKNVLLLDVGDVFQGTPYFNMFHGELEFKLMSEMKYDASTLGNHDFDAGLDGLLKQLPNAQFPFLNCNYDFTNTVLNKKILPYKIFHYGEIKVGVFGVGIELHGLVPSDLYGDTVYNDPIANANKMAAQLKHDSKCDLVICLSHLGYKYDFAKPSDVTLARSSKDIDLILGGHTHTFFEMPEEMKNADDKIVIVNQVGWAGIFLGKIDFYFESKKKKELVLNAPQKVA